jgi:hypothetical protein
MQVQSGKQEQERMHCRRWLVQTHRSVVAHGRQEQAKFNAARTWQEPPESIMPSLHHPSPNHDHRKRDGRKYSCQHSTRRSHPYSRPDTDSLRSYAWGDGQWTIRAGA